jgi:asparagine synthase (glutamine-hydrolysing)
MCGIAGWYRRQGRPVEPDVIATQCATLIHRGPDDEGTLVDGDFGFGMRRLSIIDPAGGHQPVQSTDGRYAIIFNGEIYNHLDLRAELEPLGYSFRTHSDTETILAAYQHWGNGAWSRLEGMFAVALWDRAERQLVLVRDPLGIKPLYITEQQGGLAFASELKALLSLPGHAFSIDPHAVHEYFSYGHLRHPRSIYAEVRTLPPAHVLTLDATGEARSERYWRPTFRTAPRQSEADWIEQLRGIWLDTVSRHMLADVPLGSFLSGGVDSSAVTAAMARLSGQPITAYTISFPHTRFDEAEHAKQVATHLHCRHVIRPLELADARDLLPSIQQCYDEPFADPAAVPSWYLAQQAAAEVKAVLAGDGGDEVFVGYKRHASENHAARLSLLRPALRPLLSALAVLPGEANLRQRLERQLEAASWPDGYSRFFAKTQITSQSRRKSLYAPDFLSRHGTGSPGTLRDEYFPAAERQDGSGLQEFLLADMMLHLPGQMLTKVDRASMAHSLEVRVPFLSHKLVDWAMTVPIELKLRHGSGKHILRKAVEPWLPPGVLDRPKQGFKLPLKTWFRGDLGSYARSAWHDSGAGRAGYLDNAAVDALFSEHAAGRQDHSRILYTLAVFALWWEGHAARS